MPAALKLTDTQIAALAPFFGQRETCFLVASIYADGSGWSLQVHAIPEDRRLAVRAACAGELKLSPRRKPRQTSTTRPRGGAVNLRLT